MSDAIQIHIDGQALKARRGQMLIEVSDAAGIAVPRFCYHRKLSVAANCRMCLVEVEKAPKPLPACATPVNDGMVVHTRSQRAIDAQKGVMEFLLINHPLDCPICDQGGECELQDLAMGYGSGVSRYQEGKRVVHDKDIGFLIQTDMTRCIHCTRCVRFGEEIAGLRELGATGRGEHMEIGTYVERTVRSELSGNVIDLCPVGALTSKPFRYSARAWELTQKGGVGAHDAVGSSLYFHCKSNAIKRVVPRENESINENWLSDRDRYSYQALASERRLQQPMIKDSGGDWREAPWHEAFDCVVERLGAVSKSQVGFLASASESVESLYAFQLLARELSCPHIDYRLRQGDFSLGATAPLPSLGGLAVDALETMQSALLVGCHLRHEQPILNHRLRKAVLRGCEVRTLNMLDDEYNYALAARWIGGSREMLADLLAICVAAGLESELQGGGWDVVLPTDAHRMAYASLREAEHSCIILGARAWAHPQFSAIYALAERLAHKTGATLCCLGEGANAAGAHLVGMLPHCGAAGGTQAASQPLAAMQGLDAHAQFEQGLSAYVLLGVEPHLDANDAGRAMRSLCAADFVLCLTAWDSPAVREYADVLLPIAIYAEAAGSLINCAGQRQFFQAACSVPGEGRESWKIIKVLADRMQSMRCASWRQLADVQRELEWLDDEFIHARMVSAQTVGQTPLPKPLVGNNGESGVAMQRIGDVPLNAVDSLVRHAPALQASGSTTDGAAHLHPQSIANLGLDAAARISQGDTEVELPVVSDERVPEDCVLIHAGQDVHARLGRAYGDATVLLGGAESS
ncbi:MAG: NADH-quinone oxidoreductase subunit NuoG [Candidatus Eutrophobiaceae bacterium]